MNRIGEKMQNSLQEKHIRMTTAPVKRLVFQLAIPTIISMLVTALYNIADTFFVGRVGTQATAGVGLAFPVMTIIQAFGFFFGQGSGNYISRKLGSKEMDKAETMAATGNLSALIFGAVFAACGLIFMPGILSLLTGANENALDTRTLGFARDYLSIILLGAPFLCMSCVLNNQLRFQGNAFFSMIGLVSGAVINCILDPLFILVFKLEVAGAAMATVISQALSALWVLRFLTGKQTIIPLKRENMALQGGIVRDIAKLGTASFIAQGTTCLVQIACNATLQQFGGDLYVGVMTVVNSVREVFLLPVHGITNGSQPVTSFNYGAKRYERVLQSIRFSTLICGAYTLLAWVLVLLLPRLFFGIFSDDAAMMEAGVTALRLYFFGFVFMAFQFAGQSAFVALGDARHAIFFSLLRKVIIVVPLTLLLPRLGLGVKGVFLAEPVSNILGGTVCYLTMRLTQLKRIRRLSEPS